MNDWKYGLFLGLSVWLGLGAFGSEPKPNIIVILTDDQGYADLSCMGLVSDVKTPHLDQFAVEGVRFTNGYVTAPQCAPSRAGLMTGRYQQRFGFNHNGMGPLPLHELTIANRLSDAGYRTGMVGKWHLGPLWNDAAFIDQYAPGDRPHKERYSEIDETIIRRYHPDQRGFQETFFGYIDKYWATYDLEGNRFEQPREITTKGDRLDRQTDAALRFIDYHHEEPFFLYLAYFAPHVPLDSSKKYLDRFPGDMPERRRMALAMLAAIDDGVGRLIQSLQSYGIDENTLIFFMSDNGAPLKLDMRDITLDYRGGAWDGSLNAPLNGEKGMLSEGGIRVPFLARWTGTIPGGQVLDTPVITLDVAATACAVAGLEKPESLDGENLIPFLTSGESLRPRTLYWRFWEQSAVRKGNWKLLRQADHPPFLFNLDSDLEEKHDQSAWAPERVDQLQDSFEVWESSLISNAPLAHDWLLQGQFWFWHYFGLHLEPGVSESENPFSAIGRE
ncbi:sulfatase-like hydrolase/transferase [Coraliomargarita sp. SDUM461004]|uniref:Sulfatase-like hydrolase/transferase n=1 Tax=Thalassobacterium sedimentorum TaxID=3041258 RepID=A0ABU1AMS7_9BACT|nr:sulfatase-like hydrolase/transferase [Coraliomargarita sp. SDUM461004]MDQ8195979.1 sulfatase-like hydrolase/transferase [Coraliomargarita sp. SDUM461004]